MKLSKFLAYPASQDRKLFCRQNLARPIFVAILAITVGALAGTLVKNTKVFAQSDQKKVSLDARKTSNDQIRFSNLKVGESAKNFEEKFSENKGWIGKTSFQVENVSAQEIVALQLAVLLPETKVAGPTMEYAFSLGNRPGSRIQTAKPLKFAKGEKLTIDLANYYVRIADFVANRQSIDDINQIDLEASFVFFADGTAWRAGSFMRQDPQDPNRWVPIQMPGYVPTKPWDKEDKP